MSLISSGDRSILVAKHLIPCLAMVPSAVSGSHRTIVDFGSGAGLPGVPLKIMLPDSIVILVDSRRKRASFLREVIRKLELKNVEVFNGRLAEWCGLNQALIGSRGGTDGVDLVVARAVDDPAGVFAEVQPLMAVHGRLLMSSKPGQERANSALGFQSQKITWAGGEQWVSSKPREGTVTSLSTGI